MNEVGAPTHRTWVKPRVLAPGDRVAIVAPGGPVDPYRLQTGIAMLRSWGLEPVVGAHVLDRNGYLAGRDDDRLADLAGAWADPDIKGVICARGGYGCQRIVDRLDLDAMVATPKILVGFSDITALHLALGRRGLVTFHGPMAAWNVDRTGRDSAAWMRRAIMDPAPLGRVVAGSAPTTTIAPGRAEGPLVGGNLSLLAASCGTRDALDADGCLLLLEDVGEEPYRIDRLLLQLRRAGTLDGIAGVVVGESVGCDRPPGSQTQSLPEVLDDAFGGLGLPVSYGLPLGHGRDQLTVPLGVRARLDADDGTLEVTEPATIAPS